MKPVSKPCATCPPKPWCRGMNDYPTHRQEIEKLADNILKKIHELNRKTPVEVQFDCDWTQITKNNFFYFLSYFKKQLANRISMTTPDPLRDLQTEPVVSATIRLHQLKFPEKTGVPPVDKGMLMFYNTGNLRAWETQTPSPAERRRSRGKSGSRTFEAS